MDTTTTRKVAHASLDLVETDPTTTTIHFTMWLNLIKTYTQALEFHSSAFISGYDQFQR